MAVASFKAGGSAAVFGAALWYATGQLVALDDRRAPMLAPMVVEQRIEEPAQLSAGRTEVGDTGGNPPRVKGVCQARGFRLWAMIMLRT